ncbi:MAG: modulated sigma54 specific transcriptional regulator, Fis family [Firmicutes bacterium]|nr:modulated sigma54 specific transcriptional regulator, Fis family [Bacillota bacterium]
MIATRNFPDPILPIWEDFISGKNDAQGMRSKVGDSWRRCRDNSVNPHDSSPHEKIDDSVLAKLLTEKEDLITTAKPIMSNLYEFVSGSGFVVVLADERGRIIELYGDDDTGNNLLTKDFFRGAVWQEKAAGTNAIGTAAIIHSPVQISGAEHYCQKYHGLTCSASPIFDHRQQVIGILDISGVSHMSHLHTLGMAVAAATAITAQLDIRSKNRELAVTNNRLTNIFNTISDGVLMVDIQGILRQINPAAREILGGAEQDFLGVSIERLFSSNTALTRRMITGKEHFADVELLVDNNISKFHCLASGEPVIDEHDKVIGGVIILRPIKQIQNLVNRFSGYRATLQFDDIVGESTEILETKRMAAFAATTSSNILLQGESGTGKEIFAQAIHNRSEQRKGPFVAVNCGIIPRELIGSELFGYAEGAFTGAKREGKPGKFELASGGTLFLDEIGDMPLEQQVALLRVMEDKKVTRIGSNNMIPVNVHFICATNKNLLQQVEKGLFRQDLYYRLNVISITLPPLRNRIRDIPLLFMHYFEKLCTDRKRNIVVAPEVLQALQQYDWPGNVRELQNICERAISLTDSDFLTLAHLPEEIQATMKIGRHLPATSPVAPLNSNVIREQQRKLLREAEQQRMFAMLSKHGGNVSAAARELGIARKTLYRKMQICDPET